MSADLAASFRRFTPRQQARAAVRYGREARATLAAYEAERTADNRAKHVAIARRNVELLGGCLLTGRIRCKDGTRRLLTREQRAICTEAVRDGWRTLKRYADFVEVLP